MLKKMTVLTLVFAVVLFSASALAIELDDPIDEVPEEEEELEEELAGYEISGIEVIGNDLIAEADILAEVETEIGDEISQQQLQSDMQAIFELGYFMDLEIGFRGYRDGVMLIFEVLENPMIEEIEISGNQEVSDQELLEIIGVSTGEILNIHQLDQGLESLMSVYEEQGYVLAQIVDVGLGEDNKLQIVIDEGVINDIIIRGNDKTEDYVIRRELSLQSGDVLNIERMQNDLGRLYNLGYFEDIQPNIEGAAGDPTAANLIINVQEGRTGTLSLGGGYSRESGFRGILSVSEDNLFGKGQQVEADMNFGTRSSRINLGFADRWFRGSQTSVDTNFNWNRGRSITGVDDGDYGQRYGADLMLGRPLTDKIRGYVKFDANRLYQYEDGYKDGYPEDTFSITLQGIRDTRDNRFNPRTGTRQQLSLEHGLIGEDFTKTALDLRRYFPIRDEHSIALRLKGGVGTDDMPSTAKFYLRGQDEVRGYSSDIRNQDENRDRFRGDSVLMGSVEYRHKIIDNLTGVAFFDAGRTFENQDFKFEDINHSLGLGIRVDTPIGPLGIDYGYALDEREGDFGIRVGTTF